MKLDLTGKLCVVCGSSQGIGKAIAQLAAQSGGQVLCVARSEEDLRKVVNALPGSGHSYFAADLSDEASVSALCQHISNLPTAVLINNSGGPAPGPVALAEPAQFEQAFRQHLLAAHRITQACLPHMKQAGYGRIVNIISTSVKQPLPNLGVSNTIRAAVANWAKTLSREVAAFGITVNNVLPGATHTGRLDALAQNKADKTGSTPQEVLEEMVGEIPARRLAQPEEIAAAAVFLASPLAGYINGVNLPVDGGRTGSL